MVVKSERTVSNYQVMLKRIRDAVAPGSTGLAFLENHGAICNWIEAQPWSVNTRKAYYIALKSTVRDSEDQSLADAMKAYNDKMLQYAEQAEKQQASQEMTERERKNFVRWPEILKAREKLRLSVSNFMEFQDYVIYCLYTLAPPVRVDYSPMEICETMEEAVVSTENCLVIGDGRWQFVFRNYKTASRYGTVVLDVTRELQEVLQEWLEYNPGRWLLCDAGGEPLTDKYLAKKIATVMERATGRPIGASLLRHIYITHKRRGELPLKDQQDMAKAQMHSIGMSQKYRKIN